MNDTAESAASTSSMQGGRRMFPILTPTQVARIAAHGRVRAVRRGEVLIDAGQQVVPFFVIRTGEVEIAQPSGIGETIIVAHGPGQFTGEVSMLAGRRTLVQARVREP